jgi:hypothetical protein
MSPFANSRTRRDDSNNKITGGEKDRWLVVFELMTSRLSLHGFLVSEVAWRDVHGINYLNELMTSRLSLHGFLVFEVAWRDVQKHLRVQPHVGGAAQRQRLRHVPAQEPLERPLLPGIYIALC